MENATKNTKKNKRIALVIVISAVVLALISGILLCIFEKFEDNNDDDQPKSMYSDTLNSYIFYTPDYDLDVTTVEEYMDLDRILYYKDGAEEYGINGNAEDIGKEAVFFEKYFNTAIAGDYETYNEMFTDHYYETNEPRNQFAPQMIYDMHVEKLWENIDETEERYAFNVSYRIYRNNGTFRNDIDSGASKTLYFELVYENGEMKIDRITYYV